MKPIQILSRMLALLLLCAIELLFTTVYREGMYEKFSVESFARAVMAQNPRVFERLSEM
jgi:hypothetical protein